VILITGSLWPAQGGDEDKSSGGGGSKAVS
jgi:hypothetical protein